MVAPESLLVLIRFHKSGLGRVAIVAVRYLAATFISFRQLIDGMEEYTERGGTDEVARGLRRSIGS